MKKIGEYTVRGSIGDGVTALPDGVEEKIQLFDGRFDTGYRITGFVVGGGDMSDPDFTARLTTEPGLPTGITDFWNWGDNRQVAWCGHNGSTDVMGVDINSVVDPDNMIIEDLYFSARFAAADTFRVNYMVTLEKYDISDWQGALTMVRNRSQA